ncbi:MAG: hypothetical protein DWQ34_17760 [Planctomycetota bacterium]|mgnify:CR=1 FL=1|nr:MAG: hypothetical protein DWQ34_17760 [Planctomycetota bacterium]REK28156.1 MAG: hypothetical protein DWQ41_06300 [Planctomycetota bacterium]REK36039.1 MAG: hypothetical protein DWQ45_10155 [Planctomycetota bacterium]
MSNQYIDGVFNYCDRWCERCPLTARCRLFAIQEEFQRSDDLNAAFWKVFDNLADRESASWSEELDQVGEAEHESWLPGLDDWTPSEFERIEEDDPAARLACAYRLAADHWLKQEPDSDAEPSVEVTAAPHEIRREDALEVVSWYAPQIGVKLIRALSSQAELEEEQRFRDDVDMGALITEGDELRDASLEAATDDRDGSAKVALIGIERSLGAWTVLRGYYSKHDATIREFQKMLARLRRHIDEHIPGARTFQRPGFEYEV